MLQSTLGPERVRTNRWRVSDELWAKIEPLLPQPAASEKGGRPRVEDRAAFDAILFVLRTGCAWNALNATAICSSSTAHSRFQMWRNSGLFRELDLLRLTANPELRVLSESALPPSRRRPQKPRCYGFARMSITQGRTLDRDLSASAAPSGPWGR